MNWSFELNIPEDALRQFGVELMDQLEPARQAAQNAMADIFYQNTIANFGQFGIDRPADWAMLDPKYAKQVGREYATLNETGTLLNAIKVNYGEAESSVSISKSDVPYALIHQFGGRAGKGGSAEIPARPYFPVDYRGEISERTRQDCIEIAQIQFAKELR